MDYRTIFTRVGMGALAVGIGVGLWGLDRHIDRDIKRKVDCAYVSARIDATTKVRADTIRLMDAVQSRNPAQMYTFQLTTEVIPAHHRDIMATSMKQGKSEELADRLDLHRVRLDEDLEILKHNRSLICPGYESPIAYQR